jgi:gibberellin A4 carboxyl methyltransferase
VSVTTGMIGQGFYNKNSAPQMSAIDHVLPWLEDSVSALPIREGSGILGLADFGCSEGRNSIAVMKRLIPGIRNQTKRHILTVHSDLPTNDFSALFVGLRPNGRTIFDDPGVSSCAVGGSMFERLLPPRSLHLAMTFNAIGFLSRRPLSRLPGYILPNGPSRVRGVGRVTRGEQVAFANQARSDVEAFLAARAIELLPGGKLLMQVFGAGPKLRTCDGIYDVLNDAMLEALDDKVIDQDTYDTFYQPVYFRTLAELTEPLSSSGAPFRIERQETYEAPVPFNDDFARDGDIGTFATAYTDFYRAFTEGVLRLHFVGHERPDDLISDIYRRAELLLRAAPERYPFNYIAHAVLLTRTDD